MIFKMSSPSKANNKQPEQYGLYIPDDFAGYPKHLFRLPEQYDSEIDRVLIPHGLIQDRVETVAAEIFDEYANPNVSSSLQCPLQIVCVMKGATIFTHDLVCYLRNANRLSSNRSLVFNIHYIRANSYTGTCQGDTISYNYRSIDKVKAKAHSLNAPILIVEDIIDSGRTLAGLVEYLNRGSFVTEVKVAVLCSKRVEKKADVHIDYCCFDIPNYWVIGYGFDVDDRFRDMSHICIYKQPIANGSELLNE
ncbi:hypothetical protein ACOME3_005972 [Neoechinorhynchus agilis]